MAIGQDTRTPAVSLRSENFQSSPGTCGVDFRETSAINHNNPGKHIPFLSSSKPQETEVLRGKNKQARNKQTKTKTRSHWLEPERASSKARTAHRPRFLPVQARWVPRAGGNKLRKGRSYVRSVNSY